MLEDLKQFSSSSEELNYCGNNGETLVCMNDYVVVWLFAISFNRCYDIISFTW